MTKDNAPHEGHPTKENIYHFQKSQVFEFEFLFGGHELVGHINLLVFDWGRGKQIVLFVFWVFKVCTGLCIKGKITLHVFFLMRNLARVLVP